jgi:hypothetical protein
MMKFITTILFGPYRSFLEDDPPAAHLLRRGSKKQMILLSPYFKKLYFRFFIPRHFPLIKSEDFDNLEEIQIYSQCVLMKICFNCKVLLNFCSPIPNLGFGLISEYKMSGGCGAKGEDLPEDLPSEQP